MEKNRNKKSVYFIFDKGWNSFEYVSILPILESNIVINYSLLRSEATYSVLVNSLKEREEGLRHIFQKIEIEHEALIEDKANTVEAIAKSYMNLRNRLTGVDSG